MFGLPIASILMVEYEFNQLQIDNQLQVIEQAVSILADHFSSSLAQVGYVMPHTKAQHFFVFTQSSYAFLAYRMLEQMIYPVQLVGSIGLGKSNMAEDGNISGDAWQQASKALVRAKEMSATSILYNAGFFEDGLLNMQLLNWSRLKQAQSETARIFSWAYEVQTPLTIGQATTQSDWQVERLLHLEQSKLPFFSATEKLHSHDQINFLFRKPAKWLDIHANLDKDSYLIEGFYRKGYATAISKMANTSRQNVDYHLKNGDFQLERNLVATIILQLEREEAASDFS